MFHSERKRKRKKKMKRNRKKGERKKKGKNKKEKREDLKWKKSVKRRKKYFHIWWFSIMSLLCPKRSFYEVKLYEKKMNKISHWTFSSDSFPFFFWLPSPFSFSFLFCLFLFFFFLFAPQKITHSGAWFWLLSHLVLALNCCCICNANQNFVCNSSPKRWFPVLMNALNIVYSCSIETQPICFCLFLSLFALGITSRMKTILLWLIFSFSYAIFFASHFHFHSFFSLSFTNVLSPFFFISFYLILLKFSFTTTTKKTGNYIEHWFPVYFCCFFLSGSQ